MLSQRALIRDKRRIDLACVIYCLIRRFLFQTFYLDLLKCLFLRLVIEICDLFKLSALVNKLLLGITGGGLALFILAIFVEA